MQIIKKKSKILYYLSHIHKHYIFSDCPKLVDWDTIVAFRKYKEEE